MPSSKLPRTLAEVAAMEKLPRGAYVNKPDGLFSVLINSVRAVHGGYRVNNLPDVFTGSEAVNHYFDVRSFAGVIREILTHRLIDVARGKPPDAKHFWQAQQESVKLRQRLEKAYQSAQQTARDKQDIPELWALAGGSAGAGIGSPN